MTVVEFYKFYKFLKEVMPVMKLIGEKYEEEGISEKIQKLGLSKHSLAGDSAFNPSATTELLGQLNTDP